MEHKKFMNIYDIKGFLFIKVGVGEGQIYFFTPLPLKKNICETVLQ